MNLKNKKFIKAAIKIHGELYGYYKVNYINNRIKVILVCPIHGDFKQSPASHLNGRGCALCGKKRKSKKTTEQFIKESSDIHNVDEIKILYHKTFYVNNITKVIMTCVKHGDFKQSPSSNLSGYGCPKCGRERIFNSNRKTLEDFVTEARLIHSINGVPIYDYSGIENYIDRYNKVNIICKAHGVFRQTPNSHLAGKGCPRCRESKGETKIANYLDSKKISYIREYKLDGYNYRYDFYLEGYNLLIEFHGIQHYTQNKHWDKREDFNKRLRRDKIKKELAKRNGIDLLVVSYAEEKYIEETLKVVFNNKKLNIIDISNIYNIYCRYDKNELRRYSRFTDIVYGYLRYNALDTINKYNKIKHNKKHIIELIINGLQMYKFNFARLASLENKLFVYANVNVLDDKNIELNSDVAYNDKLSIM